MTHEQGQTLTDDQTFLSIQNKIWQLPNYCHIHVTQLAQTHNISPFIGALLAQKNIAVDDVPLYLNPKLKHTIKNPFCLHHMDQGVQRIHQAIKAGDPIGIIGDYDVDGAASTSILVKALTSLGAVVHYHIPDRITEGYGPSETGIRQLSEKGVSLILTVDCGTASFEPLAYAKAHGIDVIIIDHHLQAAELPEAYAIINPNKHEDTSGLGYLCAAGVAFLVICALFKTYTPPPTLNLLSLLDLVALATICDVVPLVDLNRSFVSQGLKVMTMKDNLGLGMLLDALSITPPVSVYDVGFMMGPHINAGGRIGKSTLGTQLLTSKDPEECQTIIQDMMRLNDERKIIEKDMVDTALCQATTQENIPIICVYQQGWHPGIIGIVASRVKDKTDKPTIVIGFDADGVGKGSGRSVKGINLGDIIQKAKEQGILVAGGGHAMAAGLTIQKDKLPEFLRFLSAQDIKRREKTSHSLAGTLSLSGITSDTISSIEQLGPFGAGNPQPVFLIPHAQFKNPQVRSEKHISFTLTGEGKARVNGIAFNVIGTPLAEAILNHNGTFHVVGRIQKELWQGRTYVKVHLEDLIHPVET